MGISLALSGGLKLKKPLRKKSVVKELISTPQASKIGWQRALLYAASVRYFLPNALAWKERKLQTVTAETDIERLFRARKSKK